MERWGKREMELLAVLALFALFALLPAVASADTTITVNETGDSRLAPKHAACESEAQPNGCTLRAAVELANEVSKESGEVVTIYVPGETFDDTLGTLVVEEGAQVIVDGAGAGETSVDGDHSGAVIEVDTGGTLTVHGVTVQDGRNLGSGGSSRDGGGIDAEEFSTLSVEDADISESEAEAGGGVFAGFGASVSIEESTIERNQAREGGGVLGDGARVVLERSDVEDNEAQAGGGIAARVGQPVCALDARPGAHGAAAPALELDQLTFTVEQSTVEGNTATSGDGGGIYAGRDFSGCGGAKSLARHSEGTDLRRNAAGIDEEESFTVKQSTIARDKADVEFSDNGIEGGEGGGVYEEGEASYPVVNTTIADNTAQGDGGGVGAGYSATAVLISDTVFGNTVEPPEVNAAKPGIEELTPAGNNLVADPSTGGLIDLRNTIVAEPTSTTENCEGDIQSYMPGAGYNLDYPSSTKEGSTADTCGLSADDHDLLDVSPGLDEKGLQENGGPTDTIALLSSSPAIGVVPLAEDCAETEDGPASIDQRGEPRPGIAGDGCDIGAYEYQGTKAPETKAPETKTPETKTTTTTTTSTTTTTTSTTTSSAPAPATGVLPFKAVSPKLCSSLRRLTIHIQNVKQFGIVSAVISIDGHHKRTLSGKHLLAPINLVGLPLGTYTIEIVAHLQDGRTLHGERVYHTCVPKKPGHAYLPL